VRCPAGRRCSVQHRRAGTRPHLGGLAHGQPVAGRQLQQPAVACGERAGAAAARRWLRQLCPAMQHTPPPPLARLPLPGSSPRASNAAGREAWELACAFCRAPCSLAHSLRVSRYSALTSAWSLADSSRSQALPSCSGSHRFQVF
jgi:hypothetical protein